MIFATSRARPFLRALALLSVLGISRAWADTTSLELYGLLFDGHGNRINAPFVFAQSTLYDSAAGGSVLAQFGRESVHVGNGNYLQVFSVDDTLFAADAYLQLTINGFTMEPRFGVFYNGSYYFANGVAEGPSGNTVFKLYAGSAAPVPEPASSAVLAAGLGVIGWIVRRRATA